MTRLLRIVTCALALVVHTSCDSDPMAPPIATSLLAASSTSLSAMAGAPISELPAVLVADHNGNPMAGVSVIFSVASGGGSITGAAQTTNSDGIATVGGWTLGTALGTNILRATSASLPFVTFTATGLVGGPASLTKLAGDNQAVVAGTDVLTPPSVVVRDANGHAVAGAHGGKARWPWAT